MEKLYIVDLDGTLVHSNNSLSKFTITVLNNLIRKGMKITYSTARSWHSANKIVKDINFQLPIIVYNGGLIVDNNGKVLNSNYIEKKVLQKF